MKRLRTLLVAGLALAACAASAQMPPKAPRVGFFNDGKYWWLDSYGLTYSIGTTGVSVEVLGGFVTDFASIPRLLWSLAPPHGTYTRAAIVHDYLYWVQDCTRGEADAILLDAMEESDVWAPLRYAIYLGVRLFGWNAWADNARARKRGEKRFVNLALAALLKPNDRWENIQEENKNFGPPLSDGGPKPRYCTTRLHGT